MNFLFWVNFRVDFLLLISVQGLVHRSVSCHESHPWSPKSAASEVDKRTPKRFLWSDAKGWFPKGGFGRCTSTPATGVKVHLLHAILPLKRAKAHGGCTLSRKRGEGTFSKTALLHNRPFCDTSISYCIYLDRIRS